MRCRDAARDPARDWLGVPMGRFPEAVTPLATTKNMPSLVGGGHA